MERGSSERPHIVTDVSGSLGDAIAPRLGARWHGDMDCSIFLAATSDRSRLMQPSQVVIRPPDACKCITGDRDVKRHDGR